MPELGTKFLFLTNDKIMIRLIQLIICACILFPQVQNEFKNRNTSVTEKFFCAWF